MRVDHAPLMLGDGEMGYNAGYSFHGRMLALGMILGVMAAVNEGIEWGDMGLDGAGIGMDRDGF